MVVEQPVKNTRTGYSDFIFNTTRSIIQDRLLGQIISIELGHMLLLLCDQVLAAKEMP